MRKVKTRFTIALIALIGAILCTIPWWGEVYDAASGNVADLDEYLSTYEEGNLPERYVNVTLDASLGTFASLTYEDSSYKDRYYYIAWLNDDSFIAMSVTDEDAGIMDSLSDNTWNLLDGIISYDEFAQGEKFTFLGRITSMDSEEERFYRSTLAEYGIDDSEYNVRYQSLSVAPSDYVLQLILEKFIIQGIVALVAACWLFVYGMQLSKDRKQIRSIESSVQDYDPTNVIRRQKVVSGKEAMARVADPNLQKYLKGKKKLVTIACIILAGCVLVPSALYAYSKLATPSESASRVYVMDNSDDYPEVTKKAVGEITISYAPVLVYTPEDSSVGDYVIYSENGEEMFIAELDDKEFAIAVDEIRGTGSTTLHGYYSRLGSDAIDNAVEFYNNYYGGDHSSDDFSNLFGYYCLVVDDSYNGVGIVKSDIETVASIAIFPLVAAIIMLFLGVLPLLSFKKEMRYLTDGEYGKLESDLNSPETKEISKLIYCTDKYIVTLGSFTKLISYSDILWAYLKVYTQSGRESSYEIQILDRSRGHITLPAVTAGDINKGLMNMALNIIAEKNPNARMGYNQANIQAAEQMRAH